MMRLVYLSFRDICSSEYSGSRKKLRKMRATELNAAQSYFTVLVSDTDMNVEKLQSEI